MRTVLHTLHEHAIFGAFTVELADGHRAHSPLEASWKETQRKQTLFNVHVIQRFALASKTVTPDQPIAVGPIWHVPVLQSIKPRSANALL